MSLRSSNGTIYATGPTRSTTGPADAFGLSHPDWHADAACAEYPGLNFFPEPTDAEAIAAATAVCSRCLVRPECDAAAKANKEVGIWAGRLRIGNGQRLPTGEPRRKRGEVRFEVG